MGIVRRNVEVEDWLTAYSQNWQPLTDQDYQLLIGNWKQHFGHSIESAHRHSHGDKAKLKLQKFLPLDCYIVSGIKVEVAANMGGRAPSGYFAEGLSQVDWGICMENELILSAKDFSFTMVCGHEEGFESFYENI